eukprot:comp4725_c0_seq1/m.881 comp4725_c0_seq1/g.881  ORF comp4725_c0_seq1/g.881 comp4725_c0_seq1/m.881 type:complete len:201 (-) comp4725_c0_seq1:73-675(-)
MVRFCLMSGDELREVERSKKVSLNAILCAYKGRYEAHISPSLDDVDCMNDWMRPRYARQATVTFPPFSQEFVDFGVRFLSDDFRVGNTMLHIGCAYVDAPEDSTKISVLAYLQLAGGPPVPDHAGYVGYFTLHASQLGKDCSLDLAAHWRYTVNEGSVGDLLPGLDEVDKSALPELLQEGCDPYCGCGCGYAPGGLACLG